MKTTSLLCLTGLTGIALISGLMADEPLIEAQAIEVLPEAKIAICREAPNPAAMVKQLKELEANEESIQSILNNEEAKTTLDKLKAPIILKSMEEANQHLTRASMEKIAELLDFEKQQLAIFAWQGSGQDLLHGFPAAGDGAATRFQYTPGRTRDLRLHSAIYVMAKDTHLTVIQQEQRIIRCGVGELNIQPEQLPKVQLHIQPAPKAE